MLAGARFLWNATRGSRLAPWRSAYVRWRIETYSGQKAETLGAREVLLFAWRERSNLVRFLRWTGQIEAAARTDPRE